MLFNFPQRLATLNLLLFAFIVLANLANCYAAYSRNMLTQSGCAPADPMSTLRSAEKDAQAANASPAAAIAAATATTAAQALPQISRESSMTVNQYELQQQQQQMQEQQQQLNAPHLPQDPMLRTIFMRTPTFHTALHGTGLQPNLLGGLKGNCPGALPAAALHAGLLHPGSSHLAHLNAMHGVGFPGIGGTQPCSGLKTGGIGNCGTTNTLDIHKQHTQLKNLLFNHQMIPSFAKNYGDAGEVTPQQTQPLQPSPPTETAMPETVQPQMLTTRAQVAAPRCPPNYLFSCQPNISPVPCS